MADSEVAPDVTTAPADDVVKKTSEATKELIKEAKEEAAADVSDEKKEEEPAPTPVETETTPIEESAVEEKPLDKASITPTEEEPKPTEAETEPVDDEDEAKPDETVETTEAPIEEESKPIDDGKEEDNPVATEEQDADDDDEEPKDEIADIEQQISMADEKDLAEIQALEKKLAILKREKEMMELQAKLEEMRSIQEDEQRTLEEEERAIAEKKAAEEALLVAEAEAATKGPEEPSWSIFEFFKSKKEDEEITEEMKEVVGKAEDVVVQQVKQKQKPVELSPEDMFLSSIAYALVDFVHGPPSHMRRGPPSAVPRAAPAPVPEEEPEQVASEGEIPVKETAPLETESPVEEESVPTSESPTEQPTEPVSTLPEESTMAEAKTVEESALKETEEENESPIEVDAAEEPTSVEEEGDGQEVVLKQMSPESAFIRMALNDLDALVNGVIDDTYETSDRVGRDTDFLTGDIVVSQTGSGLELKSSTSREERAKNNKYHVSPGVYKFKKEFQKAIIKAGHNKDPLESVFDDMSGSVSGEMDFLGEVMDNLRHTLRTQMGPEIGYLTYEVAGTAESDARYEQMEKAKKAAFQQELKKKGLVLTVTEEQDNDVLVLDSKAQQVASPEAIAVKHMFDSMFFRSQEEEAPSKTLEAVAPSNEASTVQTSEEKPLTTTDVPLVVETPEPTDAAVVDTQPKEDEEKPKPEVLPVSKPIFTASPLPETEATGVPDDDDVKSTASDDSDAARDAAFDKALATGTFDMDDEKKEEDIVIPNVSSVKSEGTDSTKRSDDDAGEALVQEAA